jgi:hypothetical protein
MAALIRFWIMLPAVSVLRKTCAPMTAATARKAAADPVMASIFNSRRIIAAPLTGQWPGLLF